MNIFACLAVGLIAGGLAGQLIRGGDLGRLGDIIIGVVGAGLGCVPAPPEYFQAIREICTRYDVLFIADEVMTGWGRTGKMWGIEHWGVTPDIIATAKGMTAGYTPLSAVLARDEIWAALEKNQENISETARALGRVTATCSGTLIVRLR